MLVRCDIDNLSTKILLAYFDRISSERCCTIQGCSNNFLRGIRSSAFGLSNLAIKSFAPKERYDGNLKSTLHFKNKRFQKRIEEYFSFERHITCKYGDRWDLVFLLQKAVIRPRIRNTRCQESTDLRDHHENALPPFRELNNLAFRTL